MAGSSATFTYRQQKEKRSEFQGFLFLAPRLFRITRQGGLNSALHLPPRVGDLRNRVLGRDARFRQNGGGDEAACPISKEESGVQRTDARGS